jgi:hypothetical protein
MPGGNNTLNQLSSLITVAEHQFNVQTDYLVQWRALREDVSRYSRFALSPQGHEYFSQLGISTEPDAAGSHSHPVSKTLEDYMLRTVLPPLLAGRTFTACFLKRAKYRRLLGDLRIHDDNCELVNYAITGNDGHRYDETTELPFKPINTDTAFFGDALHYLTPKDVCQIFSDSPNLDTLYGSVEVPVALLLGVKNFSCPAYSMRVIGDSFEHAPDGVWSESYTQPLSCTWLLEHGSIHTLGLDLGVSVTWSADPCHMVKITRGLPLVTDAATYSVVGRCVLPSTSEPVLAPTRAVEFLSNYSHPVGAGSKRTIWARLSMWCNDKNNVKLYGRERHVIADFAYKERERVANSWYPSSLAPPPWVLDPVRKLVWDSLAGTILAALPDGPQPCDAAQPATWRSPRSSYHLTGRDGLSVIHLPGRVLRKEDIPSALASLVDRDSGLHGTYPFVPLLSGHGGSAHPGTLREACAQLALPAPFVLLGLYWVYRRDARALVSVFRRLVGCALFRKAWRWHAKHLTFLTLLNLLNGRWPVVLKTLVHGLLLPSLRTAWQWYKLTAGGLIRKVWVRLCRSWPRLWELDFAIHMFFFPSYVFFTPKGADRTEEVTGPTPPPPPASHRSSP